MQHLLTIVAISSLLIHMTCMESDWLTIQKLTGIRKTTAKLLLQLLIIFVLSLNLLITIYHMR